MSDESSSQPMPEKFDEEAVPVDVASPVLASDPSDGSSNRRSGRSNFISSVRKRSSTGSHTRLASSTNESARVTKIWDQLTRPGKSDAFFDDDDYDAEKKEQSFQSSCKYLWINCFTRLRVASRMNFGIIRAHPYIPIVTLLFFAALCAASIGTTLILANNYRDDTKQVAYHYGIMGRQLLEDQMDTTLESLHALMHGIHEDSVLQDLPFLIGVSGQPGSAPFLSHAEDVHLYSDKNIHGDIHEDEHTKEESTYVRNVTGICDRHSLVEDYAKTAGVVRHAAHLHGVVIHHATLLPYGVVCLSNPSIKESGYHLGQDLFVDPHHKATMEKAISSSGAMFSGPIQIPKNEAHSSDLHGGIHESEDGDHSVNEHNSHAHGNNLEMGEDGLEHDHDHHVVTGGSEEMPINSDNYISEEPDSHEGHGKIHSGDDNDGDTHDGQDEAHLNDRHGEDGHGDHEAHSNEGHDAEKNFYNIWLMHIPIDMPPSMGYAFKDHWGVLEVSVDWDEFLNESGIRPFFKQHDGLKFAIKRKRKNASSSPYLAMSNGADRIDPRFFTWLELDYRDTEEKWALGVGVINGYRPSWFGLGIGMSIFLSFFVSSLFLFSLVTWQGHKDFLLEMFPYKVLQKIRHGEVYAEKFDMVTIFFSDIVGYTKMSSEMRPNQVMKMLNDYFTQVDKLAQKHQVYKVETVGDAYLCVAGCPDRCMGPVGAQRISLFALDVIEMTNNFRRDDGSKLSIRCGMNSGSIFAGAVGQKKPYFSVFGDTVNTAARMESTSETMKIQCSDSTYRLLRDAPDYNFTTIQRGSVEVKGKGNMNTWFIQNARNRDTEEIIFGTNQDSGTQASK